MILIGILSLVGFFLAGYWVHGLQMREQENRMNRVISVHNDEMSYYEHSKKEILKMKGDNEELSKTLQINFNNRWKEVEKQINENERLRNEVSLYKEKSKQLDSIKLDFNNKWKEVEHRIHENDSLKNYIYQLEQNCTCRKENGTPAPKPKSTKAKSK